MRAGLLTEKITILNPVEVKDQFGAIAIQYKIIDQTRAKVVFNKESRETQNHEIFNPKQITFQIRSNHEINEKMLVEWRNQRYRIISVDQTIKQQITIITELIND